MNGTEVQLSDRGDSWRRRAAALALDAKSGRGARFVARSAGQAGSENIGSDMKLLPGWLGWNDEDRVRLAQAVALIVRRPALDREISGAKLNLIAECVGERLFEEICDIDIPETVADIAGGLPAPEKLLGEGDALLRASLPVQLAGAFPGATGDRSVENIAALAQQCIALTRIVDPVAEEVKA